MQKSTVQKLKAKLFQPHNIRDAEFSLALNGDVKTARKALKRSDSDYARRTYVRAVFSAVEGYITLIKGRTLLPHAPGKDTLTTADFAVLREEGYSLDSNGKSRTQSRFYPLDDTIKFSILIFQQAWKLPEKVH